MTSTEIGGSYDFDSFPYLAPRDTASRMRHFSQDVYDTGPHTHLFNLIDAICGDAGAGSLKKELLFAHFNQNLDSIYFRDLDNIFGKIAALIRYPSETYTFNPATQQLTTDAWSEVMIKDNSYRQRIKDFMIAIGLGGTPQGFRMMCRAALSVDCALYEVSYYVDSTFYSSMQTLGRTNASLRSEVVVRPFLQVVSPSQKYLLNGLLDRIRPQDTVVTIDNNGLAVHTSIPIKNVAASSSYFQVTREVTGTRNIAKLPPAQVLASDLELDPSYLWVVPNETVEAPYAAFQHTQESSQYYTYSYTTTTAIDTVQYCEDTDSTRTLKVLPFVEYRSNTDADYGPWTAWDWADCPDNFPGGKQGQTPHAAPPVSSTGGQYNFPYVSQADFIEKQGNEIVALGGQVTETEYRLPLTKAENVTRRIWDPTLAIPLVAPTQQSTVTSQWFTRV